MITKWILCLSLRYLKIVSHAWFKNIWALKSLNMADNETSQKTHTSRHPINFPSTMSTGLTPLNLTSMKIQPDLLFYQYSKVITQLYWHMDKLALVKHIQWRGSSIIKMIHRGVLFQGLWKRYLDIYRMVQTCIVLLWSEQVTCKFTMKT